MCQALHLGKPQGGRERRVVGSREHGGLCRGVQWEAGRTSAGADLMPSKPVVDGMSLLARKGGIGEPRVKVLG